MMQLFANTDFVWRGVVAAVLFCLSSSVTAQVCDMDELFEGDVKYGVGDEPTSIRVADLDGDGVQDLAVANRRSDDLSILFGLGDGQFAPQARYPVGDGPYEIEVGDIDQDGDPDLFVSMNFETAFRVLINNGDGGFDVILSFEVGLIQVEIELFDFNGDGLLDVAVGTAEGILIRFNDPVAPFLGGQDLLMGYGISEIAVGDIDQDGHIDVLARIGLSNDGCNFRVVRGTGGMSFADPTCEQTNSSFNSQSLLLDLDDDADLDLVYTSFYADEVCTMKHSYQGDYVNEVHIPYHVTRPSKLTHGDFNLDGFQDLAICRYFGTSTSVFLGVGRGFFNHGGGYRVGSDSRSIESGDLDRDGDIDLVVGNDDDDTVSVLLNQCDPAICLADFVTDGIYNFFDVSIFLGLFYAGDPAADLTDDGVINFFDVSAFLQAFNAGCP